MDDSYKMSGHKLLWHLDRVHDWATGQQIAPLYLDMGITQSCNIACKYCYYATPENRTDKIIPTPALIRFLGDCADMGVKAIGFLGDGEPMLHPGVYEAVTAGADCGLDMAISTNGVVMKEEGLLDFLRALTWIRFNISAADALKYQQIMGVPQSVFDKVVANIRTCVELKQRFNLDVTIGMQMVLIADCVDQIVDYARLGKELGVDYVVIKQCSESGEVGRGNAVTEIAPLEEVMQEAESLADDSYRVIIKRRKMEYNQRTYDHCYGCEFLPQINGAGEVYCCGNFFGKQEFYIGNICEESFKDIVFGERYRQVMERVKQQVDVKTMCGEKCRQNEINEFLWSLKNPPDHLNFI